MQATLIEDNGNGRVAYDSLILVEPSAFAVLNSKTSLKIVKSLAETPASAIDVSRKMKIHEQKVYYHMRKLEKAGIIYTISNERRHGMIAKIYSVVSPVIAAKLHDKGLEVKENGFIELPEQSKNLLSPFVLNGIMDSKLIFGDPYPHGAYDSGGSEAAHLTDFILMLGMICKSMHSPSYKLDTEVREVDMKENLILIGNAKTNTIINKVNSALPVYLDPEKNILKSRMSGDSFKDDRIGYISKINNPFNSKKFVLVIGGIRTRGIRAAVIFLINHISETLKNLKSSDNLSVVVQGLDKDGDMVIDSIKVLESETYGE